MQRAILSTLALAAPLALFAAAGPTVQDAEEPIIQDYVVDDHGPLEDAMKVIQTGTRSLRRSLRKPEMDAESLVKVAEMQAAALKAKLQSPRMLPSVPEADQAAFLVAYRKEMIGLVQSMLQLESALLDGDREAIKTAFDSMRSLEDPAHERFMQDE